MPKTTFSIDALHSSEVSFSVRAVTVEGLVGTMTQLVINIEGEDYNDTEIVLTLVDKCPKKALEDIIAELILLKNYEIVKERN